MRAGPPRWIPRVGAGRTDDLGAACDPGGAQHAADHAPQLVAARTPLGHGEGVGGQ